MSREPRVNRYLIESFFAPSLRGNALGSPARRELRVYLPPGYHRCPERRYPVVYFLHGYARHSGDPTVGSRHDRRRNYPLALRLLLRRAFARIPTLERLDALIRGGELPPFILVQPDASLHRPHKHRLKDLKGRLRLKGSLYTDSAATGRFATYTFKDTVLHVDAHYRTIAAREGRALMGASMGGYGALLGGILHPELFRAIAALSPSISCLDLLGVKMVVPVFRRLFGTQKAEQLGRLDMEDILETCDWVFSAERPLLPGVKRDEAGRIIDMDPAARDNWARSDLGAMLAAHRRAFDNVRLLFNCERFDEFGFAEPCRRFHRALLRQGIEHSFEIYADRAAERLSPHNFGIGWHILPALRFCTEGFGGTLTAGTVRVPG